jgi:hypothetical protein
LSASFSSSITPSVHITELETFKMEEKEKKMKRMKKKPSAH